MKRTPFSYKLAVRKTPDTWFFIAYDADAVVARQAAVQQRVDRRGDRVHQAVAADRLVGGVAGDEPRCRNWRNACAGPAAIRSLTLARISTNEVGELASAGRLFPRA